MFTGIIEEIGNVKKVKKHPHHLSYCVQLSKTLLKGLKIGASVSVNGTCQTVTNIVGQEVYFDAIQETLDCTTLSELTPGSKVNLERSLKMGQEIGGHLLSGHILGKATFEKKIKNQFFFKVSPKISRYLFSKGYIALDGVSLTLGEITREKGIFTVHLIPETLRKTMFGTLKKGDEVNVEIDSQTLTVVETVERILFSKK
jgi:riboflavin synthase